MASSQDPQRTTIAIGVFDGVHRGHRALLTLAKAHATATGTALDVLSFDPHPAQVLFPDAFTGLLTSTQFRASLLAAEGVDYVNFVPFNEITMQMTPAEFVETYVVRGVRAQSIFVGANFRFGHKAQGDVVVLRDLCEPHGIDVHVVELQGDDLSWSSTRIRQQVLSGNVSVAAEELLRPHRISGTVVHGDHRGRELGFPTANLSLAHQYVIPADGVYSGLLYANGQSLPAAISIGTNPTFNDVFDRRIEAHVIGHQGLNLYDQDVDVDFIGHIRGMEAFTDIDQLITAMNRDVDVAMIQIADFQGK